ncbi:hypothetical protein [Lactobacillus xylocopicola]|uniref:Surface layer protein A domain-containing protein n=1 Tax=Lactobacillus xylocopicola TaxID=2976676 RepID=A0ABM8BH52_9LACO|nr:hypothetical protein [Lactobacillus xylocopicola]BDR60597.1 hypothetical protein KIM322_08580 [Lactobacillus xylocopicola]
MKAKKTLSLFIASAIALTTGSGIAISATNTNVQAKQVTLSKGTYKVSAKGKITPGRYRIESVQGHGVVSSIRKKPAGFFSELIGDAAARNDSSTYISSYTTDLGKGNKLEFTGTGTYKLIKLSRKRHYRTTLTAGQWKVGRDIKPGKYTFTAITGQGNVATDSYGSKYFFTQLLGTEKKASSGRVTKFTKTLVKGEYLSTGVEKIKLTRK